MTRAAAVLLLGSLLLPDSRALAQQDARADSAHVKADAFLSLGYGNLVGGVSQGGVAGPGAFGLGLEFHEGRPGVLRLEAFLLGSIAELGRTGTFDQPTKLTVNHSGFGVGYRHYFAGQAYLGAGLTFARVSLCDVDTEGGPGFLGGQTVSCRASENVRLREQSSVFGLNAGAGFRAGRLGLGARADYGLSPTVESDDGNMHVFNAGVQLSFHFGK